MPSVKPLTGNILIDCAKANATMSIDIAARQCGYNNDVKSFRAALRKAFHDIGVKELAFEDLLALSKK